jgi:hypothetical protein
MLYNSDSNIGKTIERSRKKKIRVIIIAIKSCLIIDG